MCFILSLIRQLLERAEFIALISRPVDYIGEGGCIVGRDGVEQYDCARMQARGHRVESVLLALCVVDIPIGVGHRPEHRFISERGDEVERRRGIRAHREAEIRRGIAEFFAQVVVAVLYLRRHLLAAYLRKIRVGSRVVADYVPLLYHPCCESGLGLDIRKRAEKRGGNFLLLQGVEHARGVPVLPAAVEGEIEHLFFSLCVYRDGVKAVRVKIFLGVRRVLMRHAVFRYAETVSHGSGRESARVLRVGYGELRFRQRGEPRISAGVRVKLALLRPALRRCHALCNGGGSFWHLGRLCRLGRCLAASLPRHGCIALGGVVIDYLRFARAQREQKRQHERKA